MATERVVVSVSMDHDTLEKAQAEARKAKLSLSAWLRLAVQHALHGGRLL